MENESGGRGEIVCTGVVLIYRATSDPSVWTSVPFPLGAATFSRETAAGRQLNHHHHRDHRRCNQANDCRSATSPNEQESMLGPTPKWINTHQQESPTRLLLLPRPIDLAASFSHPSIDHPAAPFPPSALSPPPPPLSHLLASGARPSASEAHTVKHRNSRYLHG